MANTTWATDLAEPEGPVWAPDESLYVVEMGAEPIVVAEADRASYAEAIAIATSFSAAIIAQATNELAGIGIDEPGRILAPLVRTAVENALASAAADTIDLSTIGLDGLEDDS